MFELIGAAYGRCVSSLDHSNAERLARLTTIVQYSFLTGFVLGGWSGSRHASLVFAAEHQHVLPGIRTRREASAYFRARNARVMLGAAQEGLQRGIQLSTVAMLFGITKWICSLGRESSLEGACRSPREPPTASLQTVEWENLVAGLVAGSSFAWVAKGQRLYQLRRGLLMGGGLGLLLTALGFVHQKLKTDRECE